MHRKQARIGLLLPLELLAKLEAEVKASERCLNEVIRAALVAALDA
jgi:hypothetical protein